MYISRCVCALSSIKMQQPKFAPVVYKYVEGITKGTIKGNDILLYCPIDADVKPGQINMLETGFFFGCPDHYSIFFQLDESVYQNGCILLNPIQPAQCHLTLHFLSLKAQPFTIKKGTPLGHVRVIMTVPTPPLYEAHMITKEAVEEAAKQDAKDTAKLAEIQALRPVDADAATTPADIAIVMEPPTIDIE